MPFTPYFLARRRSAADNRAAAADAASKPQFSHRLPAQPRAAGPKRSSQKSRSVLRKSKGQTAYHQYRTHYRCYNHALLHALCAISGDYVQRSSAILGIIQELRGSQSNLFWGRVYQPKIGLKNSQIVCLQDVNCPFPNKRLDN